MINLDKDLDEILSLDRDPKFYKDKYNELINLAKAKRPTLNKSDYSEYLEKHHILPRCMGGKDEDNNFVLLNYKEHTIAHILLFLENQDNVSLSHAAILMTDPNTHGLKISDFSCKTISDFLDSLSIVREKAISSITKSVVCLDLYTEEVLGIFSSISSLIKYGFSVSSIYSVLSNNRNRKSSGGYKWRYLEDFIKIYPRKIKEYYKKIDNGWNPPRIREHKPEYNPNCKHTQVVGYSDDLSVIKTYKRLSDVRKDGFAESTIRGCISRVSEDNNRSMGINWELKKEFIKRYPNYSDKNPEKLKDILDDNRILLVDDSGDILEIYDSIRQIYRNDGLHRGTLQDALKKSKLAFGYYWYKADNFPDKQKIKSFKPNLLKIKPMFSKDREKELIIKYTIKDKNVIIIDSGSIISRKDIVLRSLLWNAIGSNSLYQNHYWLYYEDFKKRYPKELEEYEERIKNNSENKGEIY